MNEKIFVDSSNIDYLKRAKKIINKRFGKNAFDCGNHDFREWEYQSDSERVHYCQHDNCNGAEFEMFINDEWIKDTHKNNCELCQAYAIEKLKNKPGGSV